LSANESTGRLANPAVLRPGGVCRSQGRRARRAPVSGRAQGRPPASATGVRAPSCSSKLPPAELHLALRPEGATKVDGGAVAAGGKPPESEGTPFSSSLGLTARRRASGHWLRALGIALVRPAGRETRERESVCVCVYVCSLTGGLRGPPSRSSPRHRQTSWALRAGSRRGVVLVRSGPCEHGRCLPRLARSGRPTGRCTPMAGRFDARHPLARPAPQFQKRTALLTPPEGRKGRRVVSL